MKQIYLILFMCFTSSVAFTMAFPWEQMTNTPPEPIAEIHPDLSQPGNVLTLSTSGHVFRSTDWGQSWQTAPLPTADKALLLKSAPKQQNGFYLVTGEPEMFDLWITQDTGLEWQHLGSFQEELIHLAISAHIPNLLLGIFSSETSSFILKRSEDNGASWETVLNQPSNNTPPLWHPTSAWQAYWQHYRSTDYGSSWQEKSTKSVASSGYDIPPSLFATTNDGLFVSRDDLISWWPLVSSPVNFVALNTRNGQQILTGYNSESTSISPSLLFSDDAGQTFSTWSDGLPNCRLDDIVFISDWMFWACHNGVLYKYDERKADIDGSNRVDGGDLVIISLAFGTSTGEDRYNEQADLNSDGVVDGNDLVILSILWGHRFYYDDSTPPGDFPGND